MDEIVENNPEVIPCSRCGPMRRQLMNIESANLDADYVALGINLDDYSQSVLMNVARGDVDRMARMAPHHMKKDGLTRRILPLRRIPEKEVVLYALLKGIKFDSSWCPYYGRAQRNTFREILETLEERTPGASFSILKFADGIRPALDQSVEKGITFDSGGISIKPSEAMDEMKFDKCGASAVLGIMKLASDLKLKTFSINPPL